MTASTQIKPRSTRLGRYTLALAFGWSCAIITSLAWNLYMFRQENLAVAMSVARNHIEEDILSRRWNALHGGVYGPVTDLVAPDPFLEYIPERDIITPSGRRLTLISHGNMTRQALKLLNDKTGHSTQSAITSLNPLNPDNEADQWERKALLALEKGQQEFSEVVDVRGEQYLRFMQPFKVEESCLKCHADQGYTLGDIRGGSSLTVPMSYFGGDALQTHINSLWWGHILWWLLGALGIGGSYIGMTLRIAERQRAEKALESLQRQQERILSSAGEGIFGVDRNGIITFANPASLAMLGWQHDELVGQDQHEIMHHSTPDGLPYPKHACPISKALQDGVIHKGADEFYWRKDGTSFPIEYISTPIIENQVILGSVIVFTDITKRKRAEEEMALMRLYLQNVINAMPSVIIGVDTQGVITQWNREAELVTLLAFPEVSGRLLSDVQPMFLVHMEKIKTAMFEKRPLKLEKITHQVKGETRYSDVIVYPVTFNDVVEAVIRVDDVTDRVLAEDKTLQTEKMMSVASLVEGMAHEINNPLGGIMQGAQSVIRRVSPELAKNREVAAECGVDLDKVSSYMAQRDIFKFLEGIRKSGERAASIVSYMLQFSRDRESSKESRDLAALIEHALDIAATDSELQARYQFSRIKITREFADNLPNFYCSVAEMEQVLLNLIKNAAQVLSEESFPGADREPEIVVRLRRNATGSQAIIEVADNGPGMDENIQRRIFEPFFTTKPPGEGTGLGLAVSYFIITVTHRGALHVESTPGKGTKFIIRLPIDQS